MEIDLIKLIYNQTNEILVNGIVNFDDEKYQTKEIIKLLPVEVLGRVYKDSLDELYLDLQVKGTMILINSRTLKEVNRDFSFNINDKIEENEKIKQNLLDITEILWENIVLEVPISINTNEDSPLKKGEGWELKGN